jgi:NAD(P)-dependent dehydrogenase (short-subunit alcohol dehydrogenase family)
MIGRRPTGGSARERVVRAAFAGYSEPFGRGARAQEIGLLTTQPRFGRIDGRVCLVTGGANGLGRAISQRLAEAGSTGLIFDRPTALAKAEPPSGWINWAGDVRREGDVQAAVAGVIEHFGRLDIVVANAGVVPIWQATSDIDLADWDETFAVNVRGVMATIKQATPALKVQGGSVIVLGSLNSWRAHPQQAAYTASKHAVLGIVRAVALDLGRFNIRVNAIGPGPVATDALLERLNRRANLGGPSVTEALAGHAEQTALRRMVTADDVANVTLFLAGDLSLGLTGLLIPVDAGIS